MIKGNKKCSVWWRLSVLLCCAQSYTWIWTQILQTVWMSVAPAVNGAAYRRRRRLLNLWFGVVEWKAAKRGASVRQTGCLYLTFSIQMSFNFIVLRRVYEAENEPIWLWNQISVTNNKSNNTSDCQRAQQQQHWLTDCRLSHGDDGAAIEGWRRLTHRTNRGSHFPRQLQCHQGGRD